MVCMLTIDIYFSLPDAQDFFNCMSWSWTILSQPNGANWESSTVCVEKLFCKWFLVDLTLTFQTSLFAIRIWAIYSGKIELAISARNTSSLTFTVTYSFFRLINALEFRMMILVSLPFELFPRFQLVFLLPSEFLLTATNAFIGTDSGGFNVEKAQHLLLCLRYFLHTIIPPLQQ
jgi:hypothetical protein